MSGLLADLFRVSGSRAECLSTRCARATYASRVLEPSLRRAVGKVRARWNALKEPLAEEARPACLLVETMEEICRFLDSFPLAVHLSAACDECNELRLAMLARLADALVDSARCLLRQLTMEAGIFGFTLAQPLLALSWRLRPSNFSSVSQQAVGKLVSLVWTQLQQQAPFETEQQKALFVANCGSDLEEALVPAATALGEPAMSTALGPLRDACTLLALEGSAAEEAAGLLQRAAHCSPAVLAEVGGGGLLQKKEAEVLAAVGVHDLAPRDAINVLSKRPDLAASLPQDVQLANSLQELLPTGAAQGALQLGAGAVKQLQGLSEKAPLPVPVAAVAQATLQSGALRAAELRGLAGGAGRRLAANLRSLKG